MRFPRLTSPLLLAAAATAAALGACSGGPAPGTGGSGGSGGSGTTSHASSTGAVSSGSGGSAPLPDTFSVSGTVTDGTAPVEGAIVMQGGGQPVLTTGADGKYTITMKNAPGIPVVVAAKVGYRAAGFEFYDPPDGPIDLVLQRAAPPDNEAYVYGDPGNGDPAHDNSTLICGHCHTTYVADFQGSKHIEATRDPLVQDLYAGVSEAHTTQAACEGAGGIWRAGLVPGTATTTASKCYLGAGVLPDLNPGCGGPGAPACDDPALPTGQKPTAFGRCADCHAAGIDGKAGGRSLLEATGRAYENGNHCDVCHHVADVDLSKPPGVGGALVVQRPHELTSNEPGAMLLQAMFGPEPDVPNGFMGGSFQPKFRSAQFCGGCHEQRQEALLPGGAIDPVRWPGGLPTHSTYSEWSASKYAGTGATCQFCHMPADDRGLTNSLDIATPDGAGMTNGFPRPPEQLRKHTFRAPIDGSPRLFDGALTLDVYAAVTNGAIAVTTKLRNFSAGHAIPTGEPMRALLLLVRADACGAELPPSGGMTLDDWGGAIAAGTVGAGVQGSGTKLTWTSAGAAVKAGAVVRVVRPTGTYDDYPGVGFFANPTLTAPEKGIEIHAPVGEATITGVSGSTITLDRPIAAQAGDVVYVGDPLAWPPADGAAAIAIAGRAGHSFARTLVDAGGARGVPHFRAVDMVSDNRLAPGAAATTTHAFAIPPGCSSAQIRAAVIYRPVPVGLARERGWKAQDYVVTTASAGVMLP